MQKDRTSRVLGIIAICVAVLGLSTAFAALSTRLDINGTTTVTPASFKVEFVPSSISTPTLGDGLTGGAIVSRGPTVTASLINAYDLMLTKPGDSVTYTFDVKNFGTMDAEISAFSYLTPEYTATAADPAGASDIALVTANLDISLKYANATTAAATETVISADTEVANGQILKAGQSVKLKLTIGYDMAFTSTSTPTDSVKLTNYGASIIYGQK